jgi:hypothetical protein
MVAVVVDVVAIAVKNTRYSSRLVVEVAGVVAEEEEEPR